METKWFWMMDYCLINELEPANPDFWKRAGEAYEQMCMDKNI